MPIVLDYAADGAIIAGYVYNHFPPGVIETGSWQAVIPGAVYAREAHTVGSPGAVPGFLAGLGNGQMGVVDGGWQGQAQGDGDAADGQPAVMEGLEVAGQETPALPQASLSPGSRSRSPSPPSTRSQKRRRLSAGPSLPVTLPIAVNVGETGIASVANTAGPKTKAGRSTLPRASQVPHVGTTFKDRRAILLRHDDPYICNLCGTGFAHPNDVKGHFNGHPDQPGRGCWMQHGGQAGQAWNGHESCKISEADLNVERVKEGWVLCDQESWDKINAAAEAGRAFKEGRDGDVDDDGMDVEAEPVAKGKGKGKAKAKGKKVKQAKQVVKQVMEGEKEMMQADDEPGTVEKAKEKAPPRRKVVRAGDETETDVGGGLRRK